MPITCCCVSIFTLCRVLQGGRSAIQTLGTGALQHVRCIFREAVYFWFDVDAAPSPAAVKPDPNVVAAAATDISLPGIIIKVNNGVITACHPTVLDNESIYAWISAWAAKFHSL